MELILRKFSGRFSSLRNKSLGDSGESLVVHFKKSFWRLCSASWPLFFLCSIHFFPLIGNNWCPMSQQRHFSDPWTPGVRSPYLPRAHFLGEIFHVPPWTFLQQEECCTCSPSPATTLLLIKATKWINTVWCHGFCFLSSLIPCLVLLDCWESTYLLPWTRG